jgi:hypothetical protein
MRPQNKEQKRQQEQAPSAHDIHRRAACVRTYMLHHTHLQWFLLGEERVALRLPTRLTLHERIHCGRVAVRCVWSAWIVDRVVTSVYLGILSVADAYIDFGVSEISTNLPFGHTHQNQLAKVKEGHAQQQVAESPAQTPPRPLRTLRLEHRGGLELGAQCLLSCKELASARWCVVLRFACPADVAPRCKALYLPVYATRFVEPRRMLQCTYVGTDRGPRRCFCCDVTRVIWKDEGEPLKYVVPVLARVVRAAETECLDCGQVIVAQGQRSAN